MPAGSAPVVAAVDATVVLQVQPVRVGRVGRRHELAAIEKVASALAGLGPPAGRVTVPPGTVRPLPDPAGPAGVVSG